MGDEVKARRRFFWILRIGISVLLIGILLDKLDIQNMARFLARADWLLVALTLVMVAMDRSLMAARWIYLLEGLGIQAPRAKVVKIFFLSTFFGSFLPTGIGGEAVRAVSFSRLSSKGVETVASVAMDRFIGMLSMLLTGLVALIFFYRIYPHPALLATVLVLSVTAVVGMALLLSSWFHRKVLDRIVPSPSLDGSAEGEGGAGWPRWRCSIQRAIQALGRYRSRLGLLGFVLAMSVGVQVLRILQAYVLSEAMSLGTSLVYFFCFVPIILLITMLPISVSGLGTTNLAYVALFGSVGMDPDGAFVLSVLILALGVIGNLPGGVIYALEGFPAGKSLNGKEEAKHGNLERSGLLESDR
jgi:uncharacterized protein (TIRG00374 family)